MEEFARNLLKSTVEYRNWGWNAITIGAIGTAFFTILQGYGLLKQNRGIWEKESGESVSVSLFGYYLFYLIAFLVYGVEKKSMAIVFNGLLFLLCVPILVGLKRFKGFTKGERIGLCLFPLMPPIMFFGGSKDMLLLSFLFGIAFFLLFQVYEIWKEKSVGSLDFKMLVIFFLTSIFWTVFAFAIEDIGLMVFNPLALAIYTVIFALWAKYRKEPGKQLAETTR